MLLDEQPDSWNLNGDFDFDFDIDDLVKDKQNTLPLTVPGGPLSPPESISSSKKLQISDFEPSMNFEYLLEDSDCVVYSDKMLSGANCNLVGSVQDPMIKKYCAAGMSPASTVTSNEKVTPQQNFQKTSLCRQLSLLDNDQTFNINKYINSQEIVTPEETQSPKPTMRTKVSSVFVKIPVQNSDDLNTPDITNHVIKMEEEVSYDNFDIIEYIEDPNKVRVVLRII